MSKSRIINCTTCTDCIWNTRIYNNMCKDNECSECPNSDAEGNCNCMKEPLDGELECPYYKAVNKTNTDVIVTDINGLKPFINKIGYDQILNILLDNGLYTIIYNKQN